jgi:hypothetical protein
MRAPRGQRRRRACVPQARRGIVEDEHEITASRRYRITISYLSTSISNNNVISCRFDIVDGYRVIQLQYRVIQLQYRVCEHIPLLIPSHPRERIENHRKNNRLYFQANMILIAVPFTAISVIPHISDTFHYRPCNKYKIEIRTYRNFKQEMEIFLTRIDKKLNYDSIPS